MGKVAAAAVAGLLGFTLLVVVLGLATTPTASGSGGGGGSQGLPGVVCAPAGGGPLGSVAGYGPEQLSNAAQIVAAGTEMGVPQRGQVIAIATAMQESGLRNLTSGDRDSVGLFQQRANWGSAAVRMDPKSSAKLFYGHLLAVPGWQTMPLTVAAQRVQVSALPDAYAHWEPAADQVVGAALHITCTPAPTNGGPGGQPGPATPGVIPNVSASPLAREVISRANGTPGAENGPDAFGGVTGRGLSWEQRPASRPGRQWWHGPIALRRSGSGCGEITVDRALTGRYLSLDVAADDDGLSEADSVSAAAEGDVPDVD